MGPAHLEPPRPELECLLLPPEHMDTTKILYESNFVQVIEGEIDTVHSSILHSVLDQHEIAKKDGVGINAQYHLRGRPPEFFVEDTDGGILIGAVREAEADTNYWRISRFQFPWVTMPPGGGGGSPPEGKNALRGPVRAAFLVPIDDENCWFYMCSWHPYRAYKEDELIYKVGRGNPSRGVPPEPWKEGLIPGTWYGKANKHNHYMIDRDAQKNYSLVRHPLQQRAGPGLCDDGQHGGQHDGHPLEGAPRHDGPRNHSDAPSAHPVRPGPDGRERALRTVTSGVLPGAVGSGHPAQGRPLHRRPRHLGQHYGVPRGAAGESLIQWRHSALD